MTTASAELLACPFCGESAEIERKGDHRMSTIYACTMCGCRLETGEEWDHGRQWNTRAALTRAVQPAPDAAQRNPAAPRDGREK